MNKKEYEYIINANTKLMDKNKELLNDNLVLIKYIQYLRGERDELGNEFIIDEETINDLISLYKKNKYDKLYYRRENTTNEKV